MCGIAGIIGDPKGRERIHQMVAMQGHRGPDGTDVFVDPASNLALGHNRLSIIDLSPAGRQPMESADGNLVITFNGEIYNYRELRTELAPYPFRTQTDTEVILAAWQQWGDACLDRFIGMFAFMLWDKRSHTLIAVRDRFGVKPLYYAEHEGAFVFASEIKTLFTAGVPRIPNEAMWATYLAHGVYDHSAQTFWQGVQQLPAGYTITWEYGTIELKRWYDLAKNVGTAFDDRSWETVAEEYAALMRESVQLRFRSDVPVGINLSGGLDSSVLLGTVDAAHPDQSSVQAFTFVTGDDRYDEDLWVKQMLEGTKHPWFRCVLRAADVPNLAESVQWHQDEPFGGLPTIAYARVFQEARAHGTIVLLDGQGMDEQWAGYDYYKKALQTSDVSNVSTVQGTSQQATRPRCLSEDFRSLAQKPTYDQPFPDALRNLQYRDICFIKIPRALRFNDRVSMQSSTELREVFLDHRLVELALRQPPDRTIGDGKGKALLRDIAKQMLPRGISEAPKRPLQTPQREWLAGDLREWVEDCIERALTHQPGDWLNRNEVEREWKAYLEGASDNSFYVWQWISMGLMFGN